MGDDGSDSVSQRIRAGGDADRSTEAASCRRQTADCAYIRTVHRVHLTPQWIVSHSFLSTCLSVCRFQFDFI